MFVHQSKFQGFLLAYDLVMEPRDAASWYKTQTTKEARYIYVATYTFPKQKDIRYL